MHAVGIIKWMIFDNGLKQLQQCNTHTIFVFLILMTHNPRMEPITLINYSTLYTSTEQIEW